MAGLVISGVQELERISRELLRVYPAEARKAVVSGVNEALTRTKARGLRIAGREYAITKDARAKVAALTRIVRAGDGTTGEIVFKGAPGVPLRYFQTKPKRAVQSQAGVKPSRRRPKEGVRAKVLRAGQYNPALGPEGQKSFWFKAPNGAVLLGYRAGRGRTISTAGLFGASPIQALQKEKNIRTLQDYAADAMRKRIKHQLDRLMQKKGLS